MASIKTASEFRTEFKNAKVGESFRLVAINGVHIHRFLAPLVEGVAWGPGGTDIQITVWFERVMADIVLDEGVPVTFTKEN